MNLFQQFLRRKIKGKVKTYIATVQLEIKARNKMDAHKTIVAYLAGPPRNNLGIIEFSELQNLQERDG